MSANFITFSEDTIWCHFWFTGEYVSKRVSSCWSVSKEVDVYTDFAKAHVWPVSVRGWPGVFSSWHLNSQTVSLLIPLENDIGRQRSCVAICFLVIVPPVQVVAAWRQRKNKTCIKVGGFTGIKKGDIL